MQREGKANGAEFSAHPSPLLLPAGAGMDAVFPQPEHPKGTENTFSYAGGISQAGTGQGLEADDP